MSLVSSSKELDLLVSVGSGNVYGAVVELRKGTKPHILHTFESKFPIKKTTDSEAIVAHMLGAVHTTVTELMSENKSRIKTAHVVLASPWFSSATKILSDQKSEPVTVTDKLLQSMADSYIQETFGGKSASSLQSSGLQSIERSVFDIRLNGYDTEHPQGKTAQTIDLSVYVSVSPEAINKKIESELYTIVHPARIVFHTFPFIAQSALRSLFSEQSDFVLVDIGAEITDIVVVRRGSIHSLVSFPMGAHQLVRSVAIHFETEPELATSMLALYAKQVAEVDVQEKIKKLVTAFGEEWGIAFAQALQEGKEHEHFIPQKAFFVSHPSMTQVFHDIIGLHISDTTPITSEGLAQFVEHNPHEVPTAFAILETLYINSNFSS